MAPHQTAGEAASDAEVMASHDEATDEFVIADIAREDAWVTIGADDAPVLAEWA